MISSGRAVGSKMSKFVAIPSNLQDVGSIALKFECIFGSICTGSPTKLQVKLKGAPLSH